MNQIDIFRAFSIWSRYNLPTANQRSLFYGLLEVWNDTRLVRSDEWLSVPNRTLETISGLSKKTCDNVKNQLQQLGILKIVPGKRGTESAKYDITFWIASVKDDDDFTPSVTPSVTPILSPELTPSVTPKLAPYTYKSRGEDIRVEKSSSSSSSSGSNNNKLNKLQNLADFFETEFGQISPTQLEELRAWLFQDAFDLEVIKLAIKEAVLSNKRTLNYVKGILRNWRAEGIDSATAVKNRENERFDSKKSKEGWSGPDIPMDGPW